MLMKKLFTILASAVVAVPALMAQAPVPEVLYLVGSMNNWTTPEVEAGRGYVLTDPDKDGVYTGTFEFDSAPEFKLFVAPTDWSEYNNYLGTTHYGEFNIYSDRKNEIYLNTRDYGGENNVVISNWAGGQLEISARLEYDHNEATDIYVPKVYMTFKAPGQPAAGVVPDAFYIIGDFNSYALPEGESLNGAISVPRDAETDANFVGVISLPADATEFVGCAKDPESGNYIYYGNDASQPFFICKGTFRTWQVAAYENIADVKPFKVLDWKGGEFEIGLNYDTRQLWIMSTDNTPEFVYPSDKVTLTVKTEAGEDVYARSVEEEYFHFEVGDVQNAEMTVSLAEDDVWGLAEERVFTNAEGAVQTDSYYCELVRGGYPLKFDLAQKSRVDMSLNFVNGMAYIAVVPSYEPGDLERIYVVGACQGWDINSDAMPLMQTTEGVYEGTYEVLANQAMFRFYQHLGNWDEYSIGSQTDDVPIDFLIEGGSFTSNAVYGKGSWNIPDWVYGGKLRFVVDLNTMTVTVDDVTGLGIDGIGAEDVAPVYYNLQGIRVENPRNGLYIKVTPNRTEKVVIR